MLLLSLAAAVVAASAGCGQTRPHATPVSDHRVRLVLSGDLGRTQVLACSLVHHYAIFPGGRLITYTGSVRPAPDGRWKVKVKIKRCVDGRFQDSGADRVHGGPSGAYSGRLQAPGKGVYFARSRYRGYSGDILSNKVYFQVR